MKKAKAVKATAHELARIIYAMLRNGTEYVPNWLDDFNQEACDQRLVNLTRRALAAGYQLIPCEPVANGT